VFMVFGRSASHVVNLLQEPVYLVTGVSFPLTAMKKIAGAAVPGVALVVPLTAGIDAMRQLLFPNVEGFLNVWWEVAILGVLGVVFVGLAKVCLDRLERKARVEGTLGVRWQ
jgi:ABC-2 type transport system permease protein